MVKGKTLVKLVKPVYNKAKVSSNTPTTQQVNTRVNARVKSQTCSVNVVPGEVFPENVKQYFYIAEDGTPKINVNIESIRYPGSFVYEVRPDMAEMAGQFTQLRVYPDGIVKFFIEQPGGISIFIKPKTINDKNNNFMKRTVSFSENRFSQEEINKISHAFLMPLLTKLSNEQDKDVIKKMLESPDFMMTIVEGMVSLEDILCNQNQFGDPIVSLKLKPLPLAQRPSGGKSKRNKSKKVTKIRNKKGKGKTRKYKNKK